MNRVESKVIKPVKLTEAELVLIDAGLAELDRGEGMTFEQARDLARNRTKAWMRDDPPSVAA